MCVVYRLKGMENLVWWLGMISFALWVSPSEMNGSREEAACGDWVDKDRVDKDWYFRNPKFIWIVTEEANVSAKVRFCCSGTNVDESTSIQLKKTDTLHLVQVNGPEFTFGEQIFNVSYNIEGLEFKSNSSLHIVNCNTQKIIPRYITRPEHSSQHKDWILPGIVGSVVTSLVCCLCLCFVQSRRRKKVARPSPEASLPSEQGQELTTRPSSEAQQNTAEEDQIYSEWDEDWQKNTTEDSENDSDNSLYEASVIGNGNARLHGGR